MTLYISEILEKVSEQPTREAKIKWLKKHNCKALRTILDYGMNERTFYTKKLPAYKPSIEPMGYSNNTLYRAWRQLYIYVDEPKIKVERKNKLYIQVCEALHPDEAKLFTDILTGKFKFKGLTPMIVNGAFPGLVEEKEEKPLRKKSKKRVVKRKKKMVPVKKVGSIVSTVEISS